MNKYDSVLKEKKVYKEEVNDKKSHHFNYMFFDFLAIIVILAVSYIIYYRNILIPASIIKTDLLELQEQYQQLFNPISVLKNQLNYSLEGTITLNDLKYNYNLIRDQEKMKLNLNNQTNELSYYFTNGEMFLQLNSDSNYYQLGNDNLLNLLYNLNSNFQNRITEDKYIKKFYFQDKLPIVEINLVLSPIDIKSLFANNPLIKDNYEILLTIKNNAVTNKLTSLKLTINNQTKQTRDAITIQDNIIEHTNDKNLHQKFILTIKNDDFTIKIYNGETLYSVLNGIKKEASYQYTYQVIDKIYNLNLNFSHDGNQYQYDFSSNIEKEEGNTITKTAKIITNYQKNGSLREDTTTSTSEQNITEEEKQIITEVENPLRQFIEEYQKSID